MRTTNILMKRGAPFFVSVTALFFVYTVAVSQALASPIVRSGNTVSIESNQVLENDFYGLGGTVSISGTTKSDVYVAGGTVTTNADIGEDFDALGGVVQLHGAVKGSARIVGGEVTIAKPIAGDVVVLAGALTILSTGSVSGDVLFLGGTVNIEGEVHGSVVGTAEQVTINSPVDGDVNVRVNQALILGDAANIQGNLNYTSFQDVSRAQSATIKGTITKNTIAPESFFATMRHILSKVFIVLFATLSFFLIFRSPLERLVAQTVSSFGKQGIVGFFAFIGIPFLSVILIASVLGSLVGVALLVGYLFLLFVAGAISGVVLGGLIFHSMHRQPEVTLISTIVGTFLFALLPFIPVLGPMLMVLIFFFVFGGIVLSLYHLFR